MFERLCKALGAPELLEHADYATSELRSRNRAALNEAIAERTRTRGSEAWIAALNEAGVPCGPIYRIDQTFANEQVRHLAI